MIASRATLDEVAAPASWIDDQLIAETKEVWGPKYGRALTTAEAIEILQNMGRLLDALQE